MGNLAVKREALESVQGCIGVNFEGIRLHSTERDAVCVARAWVQRQEKGHLSPRLLCMIESDKSSPNGTGFSDPWIEFVLSGCAPKRSSRNGLPLLEPSLSC